ncbi:interactor of HORMAD1 protein 1 isoform X1 [Canis lupus baileyi]|uniref:Interactor of HORMAD1 1 n=1 Tax=Canis lupus dingo TaxID=286419 RepID=A0A8C0LCB1_CANLU|nr:interactor of HORMAD1 protein 1 isoform X1 [Canis lupus dingo]XP_025311614.1 interactor of HORMAD1 protein 1 isoform X1 [Canis lupus dingo]XP_025311615.1 interactor of HORMAD1 protein 1 isoform X1 [Canis lupus dingo]XP_025311616.1 interactor of HORMAD1 protein 1 isoform X1 [Canis lupus dingo]XP_035559081.1 interactor of HORMAD1 protein 1 isoform X1 [Canis lupus dingo]XP_048953912.1 interactor of HORMAD1 protein 1 isoform X1 [Canis lupus dingo]XP_048953913.1 interactor of HORMAD1 protein 1 
MNFNVWNIKEMLSIPSGSGTTKSSSWNNNQTDHSSLSDSQFLFGSQFCPESSETLSAPLDFGVHLRHPKQSQPNSLDSEPSIFTKYQAKPQLFGGDTQDRGLFPLPLSVGKSKGLLEQFEEKKKSAKDKCDSETLYNFISHIRESIHRLQTSVEKSEEHLSSRSQTILDCLETVTKTLQETVQAHSDLVLETVHDKGNMEQVISEIQKRFEARQAEFIEMKSDLKHLEVLVAQQSKDFQQLCEQLGQLNVASVLAELKTLISVPWVPGHVKDSTSQTSPPLAQSLNFTRHDRYASEEPVMWQAQALPGIWNLNMGSPQPVEFRVQSEGAKSDTLQEETALMAAGTSKRNRQGKDKAVQTNCENRTLTKTSSEYHGSGFPGCKVPGDRDWVSQRASRLIPLDLNNFETCIKNTCQKCQGVFPCDPCEQKLRAAQKRKTVERGGKGKKQQPRKSHRGRLLARKQEQTPSRNCAVTSKYPQPPVSGPQRSPLEQQEPLAQPLHLWDPRSPTKLVSPVLAGTVMPGKTMRAAQRSILQLSGCSSLDNSLLSNSFQGDHHMSWFSDLNLGSSERPLSKEPGKNMLYDLGFDSSDDGF